MTIQINTHGTKPQALGRDHAPGAGTGPGPIGAAPGAASAGAATGSQGSGSITQEVEYYILCPQRATEVPGLITHLISRDICEKRQAESYHKCPTCIRSLIFKQRNGRS